MRCDGMGCDRCLSIYAIYRSRSSILISQILQSVKYLTKLDSEGKARLYFEAKENLIAFNPGVVKEKVFNASSETFISHSHSIQFEFFAEV